MFISLQFKSDNFIDLFGIYEIFALTINADSITLSIAFVSLQLTSKLSLMGAHEEDSVLLQILKRPVVLHQVSTIDPSSSEMFKFA